jgi:hypothetical protein
MKQVLEEVLRYSCSLVGIYLACDKNEKNKHHFQKSRTKLLIAFSEGVDSI